jgi:DNA-binding XRE family transcriptional regulator
MEDNIMKKEKSDLQKSIAKWKQENPELVEWFDAGFEDFKIGVLLKQAREDAGMTQTELANQLHTQRTAISRLENKAENVTLSTLHKAAHALGKKLELRLA